MSQEFNTLELARIYESQGYFQDAFDMYQALSTERRQKDDPANGQKINASLKRMESALENQPRQPLAQNTPEKRIDLLWEQWLTLLILQKRTDSMKPLTHL